MCIRAVLKFIVIYYILKDIITAEEDKDYSPHRKPRNHEVYMCSGVLKL